MNLKSKGKVLCDLCRKYFPKEQIKSRGCHSGTVCEKCSKEYSNTIRLRKNNVRAFVCRKY